MHASGQNSGTACITDALAQCAIYKLTFKTNGNVGATQTQEGYKRQVEGGVVIRPGAGGLVPGGGLPPGIPDGPLVMLQTMLLSGSDENAVLLSVSCQGTADGSIVVDSCGSVPLEESASKVLVERFRPQAFHL